MSTFRTSGSMPDGEAPLSVGDSGALVAGFIAKARGSVAEARFLSDKALIDMLILASERVFETDGDFQQSCRQIATRLTLDSIRPESAFDPEEVASLASVVGAAVAYAIGQGLTPEVVLVGRAELQRSNSGSADVATTQRGIAADRGRSPILLTALLMLICPIVAYYRFIWRVTGGYLKPLVILGAGPIVIGVAVIDALL